MLYKRIGKLRPGKSVFDLSYEKKLTCKFGQLIPVQCDEAIPGDFWRMAAEVVVRFQPMMAPILHEVFLTVHTFFVPYRLLDDDFEKRRTGGQDGKFPDEWPKWENPDHSVGSLWDYLGFPLYYDPNFAPIDYPRRAYNLIYHEYYRDQDYEVQDVPDWSNQAIKLRYWSKDYFTTARPFQQRGDPVGLPVLGSAEISYPNYTGNLTFPIGVEGLGSWETAKTGLQQLAGTTGVFGMYFPTASGHGVNPADKPIGLYPLAVADALQGSHVNLDTITGVSISIMRTAFQLQKYLERNARAGARYVEWLAVRFGLGMQDVRLQRPEYIGGMKCPIIISEVLQTESSDNRQNPQDPRTPQGNIAGHGIGADRQRIGRYRVKEDGLIMSIMSITPKPAYMQGLNRQWLKDTRYDFYIPEFAHLSERPVMRGELYVGPGSDSREPLGYQGMYDEHRQKMNMTCGMMRETFHYWHLTRKFQAPPEINLDFLQIKHEELKHIFAVQDEDPIIVNFGNIIKAVRPLPYIAEPGLIDHF